MIQTKYNKFIYDSADVETLREYSHLRVNVLSVLDIRQTDKVLLLGESCIAIKEWLEEKATSVDVAFNEIKSKYNFIICVGQCDHTPEEVKEYLCDDGVFALVGSSTFYSKAFAKSLLKNAGLNINDTYMVTPNYQYATEIIAEDYSMPGVAEATDYVVLATNSAKESQSNKLLYRKLSNERNPKYSIYTDIVERDGNRVVIKRPYSIEAREHISRVFRAYEGLSKALEGSAFSVNKSTLVDGAIESEFIEGKHIDADQGVDYIENIKKAFLTNAQEFVVTDAFREVFGEVEFGPGVLACEFLDIDLIFDNIINNNGKWEIIDYEWTFDFPIPINYVFYRAKKFSVLPQHLIDIPDSEVQMYEKMEEHFQTKYCFEEVYNLHEIQDRIAGQNRNSADFTIASRDYQIKQLQELMVAKDVHIRNIESERDDIKRKYDQVTGTRGYQMLENWRAFKSIFTGETNPKREAKKAAKVAAAEAKKAYKAQAKDNRVKKSGTKDDASAPSIAVHAHMYYVDLLPEFITYFENIPYKFDLYVSVQEGADINAIQTALKPLKQIQILDVRALPNRGRDLAPLYCKFASEILNHDYFLHIHSKKSLYSGVEKGQWRKYSLEVLLGSREKVEYIFDLFKSNNAGLIYPDIQEEVPSIAYSWLKNEGMGREILARFGITDVPEVFNYPAGSFFWARSDALRPLLEHGYTYEDFPREQGQTDGTLAHALERVLPFISRNQGYDDYILYLNQDDTKKNLSLRPFINTFKVDKELLTMKLGAFDVVSFDIFDTLITRTILAPNDVFKLMGELIKEKYGIDCDFLKIRKQAESLAKEKHGNATNIDHIYLELAKDKQVGEHAPQIKQLEIDTEFKLCIPRKDMVDVYNAVKRMGCHVILVSDMYLTKAHLVAMLHKCGIGGYDDIFISCDRGARKDDGSMWDLIFAQYMSEKFIHVGDNFCSDSQMLMDRGVASHIVLNSKAMLELSQFSGLEQLGNEKIDADMIKHKNSSKFSLADSLMLGQAINGGIFNSPFAFDSEGRIKFENTYDFGYTTMGPLLTYFTQWLVEKNEGTKERLLLLSREGYMLEKLIKSYQSGRGLNPVDAKYFLTSRRAVAVPAIENDEDLRELISQKYEGSFSNLLWERLGLTLHQDDEDFHIDYDTKPEVIMTKIEPYKDELFENVSAEKNSYLVYTKDNIADAKAVSCVDVGFSGTIQYFLMKLTGRDIGGHYLCLHSNKPNRIGGHTEAVFEIKDKAKIGESKLLKYQLFLENALSAPFGQLICFEMKDGVPVPKYKSDNNVSPKVEELQKGILDFAAQMANVQKGIPSGLLASPALVENIFYDIIAAGTLTEDIASSLTVEDGYSRGGVEKFDVVTNTWKVD